MNDEALERFKDEQMMQALEEGWFNARYAWLFRDRVRPPDPVAEEVAQWLKFNPETGMFDLDAESGDFYLTHDEWKRLKDASPFDSPEFYRSVNEALDYNSFIYNADVDSELFETLDCMHYFDQTLGKEVNSPYQEHEYRLIEWRAW